MKHFLKSLYFGAVVLFESIVSMCSILLFSKYSACRQVKALCKDRMGKVVTVLGNGPSAKEIISNRMDLIENTDVIAMNLFGNSEDFFRLKPQYYIFVDPLFFDPNYKAAKSESVNPSWAAYRKLQENLLKVDWHMVLFLPTIKNTSKVKELYGTNPLIHIVYINATRVTGYKCVQKFAFKHHLGVASTRNVIIPALQVMISLGYKTMYVYGMEFSWTKTMDIDPQNGKMFFNDGHSFGKANVRYFNRGGYKWWLEAILISLNAMEQVALYAESVGVKIVNRTKGSFVDSFDYENPDNISLQ